MTPSKQHGWGMSTGEQAPVDRRRILVGVDGSEDSFRAVRYAIQEALATDSELWIVNAEESVAMVNEDLWATVMSEGDLRLVGQRVVDRVVAMVATTDFPADRVTAEVVPGLPDEALTRLSSQAALMVVGRRSIGGLERMFVGSTSVHVAAHSSCPVIVVSAQTGQQPPADHGVVGVAISSWPPHSSAVEWAAGEAAQRGSSLQVVHAVPADGVVPHSAFAKASAALDAHLQPLREQYPDLSIEMSVRPGYPIDDLIALSETVDLLVLGVHPARLSGLARGVLAHSHCPVGLTH